MGSSPFPANPVVRVPAPETQDPLAVIEHTKRWAAARYPRPFAMSTLAESAQVPPVLVRAKAIALVVFVKPSNWLIDRLKVPKVLTFPGVLLTKLAVVKYGVRVGVPIV
jgi:hypothetical protein